MQPQVHKLSHQKERLCLRGASACSAGTFRSCTTSANMLRYSAATELTVEGRLAGANIAAAIQGRRSSVRPFRFTMHGQFAAIGRQRAVAALFSVRFSRFLAWLLWRSVYLF